MKKTTYFYKLFVLVLLLGYIIPTVAQNNDEVVALGDSLVINDFRVQPNRAFAKGEKLKYLAHYGFLSAGKGVISMDSRLHKKNNRDCYKVDIDARTVGVFALGMKVKDKWRSYIDTAAIMPHESYRDVSEGRHELEETCYFDQRTGKVKIHTNKRGEKKLESHTMPAYTQDIVSGCYYLRTLSYETMNKGDIITVDALVEDELYSLKVRFEGREVLKTKLGKINTFILRPIIPDNNFFAGEDAATIWISDDANRVPLKVDLDLVVGSFEIEITEHEGLLHEFNWAG